MKRFLIISPREGSAPRATTSTSSVTVTSASSGTGSSCHVATATSTKTGKRKFDDASYDKEKRKRTFQGQWLGEFSWLSHTSDNDTMACSVCQKFTRLSDPKSALVVGTNKFRIDPLYKHEKTTCHIACVNQQHYLDSKAKAGSATSTAIGRGILALHEKHRKRLMILFNTAYGLAKKNRPFTDFPTVCSIQEKNGLVLGENYITDKAARQFTSCIAKTLRQNTAADLQKARFVSVLSDGSTDTTIVEQVVAYVR